MTEIIDLATLATLGQHFSTHEDAAELKGALAKVQNDLELIKSFLLKQFGSNFSDALRNNEGCYEEEEEEEEEEPVSKKTALTVQKVAAENAKPFIGGAKRFLSQAIYDNGQQQHHSKPPPLQRFSRVPIREEGQQLRATSANYVSASSNIKATEAPPAAVKSEKFHRNFLSMSSLKSNGGSRLKRASGGNSSSFKSTAMVLNKINGGSLKVEPLVSRSSNALSVGNKTGRNAAIPEAEAEEPYGGIIDDEEFNVSEAAYAAVAVSDGNCEENEEEDFGYAAYDESEYQEGDYDESMTQTMYQDQEEDDGTLYQDYYPMEGLEVTDSNGTPVDMISTQSSSVRLINGRRSTTTNKSKTQQRRLSLPAAATSSGSSVDANMADNSGDPNFLKKCKVCHEEVPAYSLFNHVVSTHYNGEVPTCSLCKKTFTYKQGLISHMRYHDAEKYDKACSYCGKKFIRKSDVVIHERRLHTGERPFQCPVPECNQGFVRRYCLLTHVKTNHGEPYMSQIIRGEL